MQERFPSYLSDISVIRSNQRFVTATATYDKTSERVFVKGANDEKLAVRLLDEAYAMIRMGRLSLAATFPFAIPQVLKLDGNFLITSVAAGETMPFRLGLSDISERVEFLAASYAAIDCVTELVHPTESNFTVPNQQGETLVDFIKKRINACDYSAYFDTDFIRHALDYLDQHAPELKARFTHADFTPDNVMEDGSVRTLIDWESATELWPRFYDVVNFTHNKALEYPELKRTLDCLVESFFEKIKSSPASHLQQLNGVAILRALSMVTELITEPDNYHNTQTTMTAQRAEIIQKTIENVLQGRLYYAS